MHANEAELMASCTSHQLTGKTEWRTNHLITHCSLKPVGDIMVTCLMSPETIWLATALQLGDILFTEYKHKSWVAQKLLL